MDWSKANDTKGSTRKESSFVVSDMSLLLLLYVKVVIAAICAYVGIYIELDLAGWLTRKIIVVIIDATLTS